MSDCVCERKSLLRPVHHHDDTNVDLAKLTVKVAGVLRRCVLLLESGPVLEPIGEGHQLVA